jgi:hypothetical protein
MYAGRVHCPVLILHGGSDITVPIRSAERIANAIRSGGNSGVTVRIILGVSKSLLPNPLVDPSPARNPLLGPSGIFTDCIADCRMRAKALGSLSACLHTIVAVPPLSPNPSRERQERRAHYGG